MSKCLLIIFISITPFICYAQDTLIHTSGKQAMKLADVFTKGKLSVHARSVFMNTINEGALKDDYALAAGAGIGLTTKSFHGFQAGISTFIVNNIFSSDLEKPDSITLMPNRYEAGLYDVQNLKARNNLVRIENFFLQYTYAKTTLTIGKFKLNTPFLNPQDGRMNATMEEGIWLTMQECKVVQVNGGWLWNISPRSTVQWLSVANSMGIYPVGVTTTGVKSGYANNVSTSGIAMINIGIVKPMLRLNFWDMLIDNVMNTAMLEVNTVFGKQGGFYQGIMFIHQDAINNGGNADPGKAYLPKGAQSNVISAQAGMKTKKLNISLNVTHITGDGRYLMPREWGRDPLYTFMPREKNDGFGKLTAATANLTLQLSRDINAGVGYGYFHLPDVKDYRLNKYGIPSYHQLNTTLTYTCRNFFEGLEIRFLGACKIRQGEAYKNPKFIYNKVNMANLNLILDFKINGRS